MTSLSAEPEGAAAGNPWIAVRPGQDARALARAVSKAHQAFVETRTYSVPGAVRSIVRESWMRSAELGVDPDSTTDQALGGLDLERYRSDHPMSLVRPVVRKLLVEDAADTGLLVAITDASGRMLWVEGDSAAKDRATAMNFVEGSDWSESRVGTNAPGTALAIDHSVQIFAAEHFSRPVQEWSCSAAPVHNPLTGSILGAIDITGGPGVAVPSVLSLVRATVAAAESELRLHLLEHPDALTEHCTANLARAEFAPRLEVVGSGRPSLVRGHERVPLTQRHAEMLVLLAAHPEGLSADHLAVLLDENELDSVTVRAEMSRLRKVFGSDGLASRPYRLLTDLRSDITDVEAALDRGDLAGALRRYGSPVLPGSFAPGVRDIREQLRLRVQAALLHAGDPALLAQWTSSVHGREDPVAWDAYRACLDPSNPQFARAQARARFFAR